jgi:hypothetical protein
VKHPESRGFREPPLELSSTEEFTTEPIRDHPFFWPDRGATPEGGIWECTFPGCGLPVVEHDYFVVDNDGGHDDPWSCTVAPITALTRVADPTNEE